MLGIFEMICLLLSGLTSRESSGDKSVHQSNTNSLSALILARERNFECQDVVALLVQLSQYAGYTVPGFLARRKNRALIRKTTNASAPEAVCPDHEQHKNGETSPQPQGSSLRNDGYFVVWDREKGKELLLVKRDSDRMHRGQVGISISPINFGEHRESVMKRIIKEQLEVSEEHGTR